MLVIDSRLRPAGQAAATVTRYHSPVHQAWEVSAGNGSKAPPGVFLRSRVRQNAGISRVLGERGYPKQQWLRTNSYEHASRELHAIGAMVGGWLKALGAYS
jgi:hypothetical protein